jgi:hypothetical protein
VTDQRRVCLLHAPQPLQARHETARDRVRNNG